MTRLLSEEHKAKLRLARHNFFENGGQVWSKGQKFSLEYRAVLSKAHQGQVGVTGEKHGKWKGNEVGYPGIHAWVRKQRGTPELCEYCGLNYTPKGKQKYFHWANKSRNYLRELTDWVRLCAKCHIAYDRLGIINL